MYFVSMGLCRYVGSFSELQFLWLILRKGLHSSFDEIIYNYDILPSDIHLAVRWSLSDPNLLKGMLKGKTQNSNLHSVVCICCTKSVFVGQRKLKSAVALYEDCLRRSTQTEVCSSLCCGFVQRWCVSPRRSDGPANEVTQAFTQETDLLCITKEER